MAVGALLGTTGCGGQTEPPNAVDPFTGLEEVLTIGSMDGVDDALGNVGAVVALEEYVFVLDRMQTVVKVFDAQGTFRFHFGRKGEGPGEFEGAADMRASSQGDLYVRDSRGRRINRFSSFSEGGRSILYPCLVLRAEHGPTDAL